MRQQTVQDLGKDGRVDGGLDRIRDTEGDAVGARNLGAMVELVGAVALEMETAIPLAAPDIYFRAATSLMAAHLQGRIVTITSLAAATGAPYATAMRKLREMIDHGLIEQRPRTRTGRSFSLHPSPRLMEDYARFADRVGRLCAAQFVGEPVGGGAGEYFFGGSYMEARAIGAPAVLTQPLQLTGGLRGLVHGDPSFMVMKDLKRQFEHILGCETHQRAFSIDRLREEALRNAERRTSLYDLIAVDLPWVGEFAERGVLAPLDDVMDVDRLDPADFHPAGWRAAHWRGRPYGVPAQTTPELLFYRRDLFEAKGLEAPTTTDAVLTAARTMHDPARGRYGIAWNAARGTPLGHSFIMACADFGQPVVDMPAVAGGYDTSGLHEGPLTVRLDTDRALAAAEYLLELSTLAPPNLLSMSWYERVKPYAAGTVPMAYGYTLLTPYFERDPDSPANGTTGYLPHPPGPTGAPIAPVGGYVFGVPANLAPERREAAVEALVTFTSPEAQKLYVLNGSRTAPRTSVSADPEVRRLSPIFEAVDAMSWRDELQFWPRPPIPQISEIIRICGEELHDMLRNQISPREALARAQARAERAMEAKT
jgi:multiple sugar transport system substrate-binding protein